MSSAPTFHEHVLHLRRAALESMLRHYKDNEEVKRLLAQITREIEALHANDRAKAAR